ncbi:gamma-glutamyltransferase [Marinilabilia sp.]|uniref:gamma-glutamyltransferase n=1 Tax=Marinilabilia sp. TaxID=2021252 RepID=UPI0025C3F105|nr:gamma-glutamyltransferase [Marinilabilia sp.]
MQYIKNLSLPIIFILFFSLPLTGQDRITGHNYATRSEIIGKKGMVATSHPLATQIGLDILKQGGNAVDAAIAANAALGLMEPTGSGIGGDLFALVWDAESNNLYGINGSGRSPQLLTIDYFLSNRMEKIPAFGPLPVTVPGCVDAWFELHDRFGTTPMSKILEPSIQYAEEGFPVTELISHYWTLSLKRYQPYPNVMETYSINGKAPQKGDLFKNPDLANTYKLLAKNGKKAFYNGPITKTIVNFIQGQGGFLSEEDFALHKTDWTKPVSIDYRGHKIWELPPNGQGITAQIMLNILEGFQFSQNEFGTARHLHLVTEAKKLAFEDRARFIGDPDFYNIPLDKLLSKEYAAQRRALIDTSSAQAFTYEAPNLSETIYLTVADQWGNMVSLIQSNYRGMGSGMVPPGLGFMLQNRGELFSLAPGAVNEYAPGKRPFHTIIPAFVTKDNKPWLSFGVMGGDFQPQGHVQIIMNLIDFNMNLQEAGDAPRFSHTGGSSLTGQQIKTTGQIHVESGIPYETVRTLLQLGHPVSFDLGGYGGFQGIMYDHQRGIYIGASESRKDGQAAGY